MREFDNWKGGIPIDDYMASWFRHFFDCWKYVRGMHTEQPDMSFEDCLCAALFNNMGMLFEVLRQKDSLPEPMLAKES
jgi:hypothetical protein